MLNVIKIDLSFPKLQAYGMLNIINICYVRESKCGAQRVAIKSGLRLENIFVDEVRVQCSTHDPLYSLAT